MLRALSLLVIAVVLPIISQCPPEWAGGSSACAVPQPASTQTTTVSDPVGDANFNAPAFQDEVLAQFTKTASGDFELLLEMAGPVPADPGMPPPANHLIVWAWNFDLDPATFPYGYPYHWQTWSPSEFTVFVSWDGTAFAGTAIDRRPALTGGEAVLTPVSFSISGTTVQATLPYALIGDVPASFGWYAGTGCWSGPLGTAGGHHLVDKAIFTP